MIPDELCPECHGRPSLALVRRTHNTRKCLECGHRWNEERQEPLLDRKGWVRR
jgi:Zn ribbon nucleic-acid-binding protein